MAKRLLKFLSSLLRWMARQLMTFAVVAVGVVMGWGLRRAVGPVVVSEELATKAPRLSGPRPPALGTTDSAAREWLEGAKGADDPTASLAELKRALDAGEISDFARLARSLLAHPLPFFRAEALALLFPAWGEKDPVGALRFAAEHEQDLVLATYSEDMLAGTLDTLGRVWVGRDPEAALKFVLHERPSSGRLPPWSGGIWAGLLAPGPPGSPGVVERLKLVAAIHGEERLSYLMQRVDSLPPETKLPTAAEWRELAASAASEELKARAQIYALSNWLAEQGDGASVAESRRWIGQELPANVESVLVHMGAAGDIAAFLRSEQAQQLPIPARDSLLSKLMRQDPDQARAVFAESGGAAWVDPATLARSLQGKAETDVQAWLALLPDGEKRQELIRQLVTPQGPMRTADDLAATVNRALSYGGDGEAGVVATLTDRSRVSAQQVPDVFAAMPPEVQANTRLEVVLGLGSRSPDAAAEIWMDATPAELAQPGASVVAELLAERLLRRDSEVGSAWIQQLPPGESRDRAVARMIEFAAPHDVVTSAQWAATVVDPAARARAEAALKRANAPSPPR